MKLERAVAEVFNIPEASVVDGLHLIDIPTWDSLAHMMLIVRLEEEFQVQLDGDEIADLKSVADARNVLRKHGAAV